MQRRFLVLLIALTAILAVGVMPAFAQDHPTPTPVHPTPTPDHPTPTPEHPTPTPVVHPTDAPTSTPVPLPTETQPTEPPPPPPPPTEEPLPPTIADIVVASATGSPPQFVTLLAAVQAADPAILAALADREGRLTVFAPTDEAFERTLGRLGINAADLLADRAQLTRILQYHVIPGVFTSGGLANIATLPNNRLGTLANASLVFTSESGLRVNNIPIIAADISAANGVIHVISEVLIPPVYVQPTIAEIVVASSQATPPQFVTLLAAVQAADPSILAALSDRSASLTVFAPTDAAFAALLAQLGVSAEELLSNTTLLTQVLQYHVLGYPYASGDLIWKAQNSPTTTTLLGEQVTFSLRNGALFINDSQVIVPDIYAVNGIIHIIDAVLLPPAGPAPTPTPEVTPTPEPTPAPETPSIAEIVVASAAGDPPQFTVLLAAVLAADPGILAALSDDSANLTVFAPTDAAFAALLEQLGVTAEELLADTALLTQVLQYHVLAGRFASGDLVMVAQSSHPSATTLLGEQVIFTLRDGSLFVNESQVIQPDIQASNGIIHVIDAVLLPPAEQTIAEIVVASAAGDPPQFTVLLAAVLAADPGILAALSDENGSLTVFAPTDDAFAALLAQLGVTAEELLGNTALLTQVLQYHVLAGEFGSAELIARAGSDDPTKTTLLGEQVTFTLRDGGLFVNESLVIQPDIQASNGIIHVINAVLLPPADPEPTPTPDATPTPEPTPAPEQPSIAEIVVASASGDPSEFSILLAAVLAADPGILAALSDDSANLTVFAPTDAAFTALLAQLGVSAEELLGNTALLNRVLQYHVLPFRYGSGDLIWLANSVQPFVFSLIGERISLGLRDGALFANDSQVVAADIQASNGIIHVIDAVLLPPAGQTIAQTVIDSAAGDPPQFTILLAAVLAADPGILAALSDEDGTFTVFAPTDTAFAALLEQLGVTAEELLANTELLTQVLQYHVLPFEYAAGDLIWKAGSRQPFANTLLGANAPVNFTLRDGSLFVNESRVIAPNIQTTNGLIHVIDAVLLPPG
jgi:uncharacterized surface protein with fasciclin (FAS1) repeats